MLISQEYRHKIQIVIIENIKEFQELPLIISNGEFEKRTSISLN